MIQAGAHARWFPATGTYPIRPGNLVRHLIDGGPAFERICQAVEEAQHSVWVTVAFLIEEFQMPGGRGSLFDVLEKARQRGLDVRVLFWRNNPGSGFDESHVFSGTDAQRGMLAARGALFLARWDRAERNYCQHQKSWIVDAGHETEIAFVGGINLEPDSVVSPGHDEGDHPHTHDIYLEVQGPCATDVHHNFVQRWNEASERSVQDGVWPDNELASDLAFPARATGSRGGVLAQVQRTVRSQRYTNNTPPPNTSAYDISKGERTCFEQYEIALKAASRYVYLENQALGQPETVEGIHAALARDVVVTVLVPARPNQFMAEARRDPRAKPFFDRLGALARHPNFLLAGIARRTAIGTLEDIYVHAKAGIVDDGWVTIGSCNIGARSFFGDTELNVSYYSPEAARAFRTALFEEHIGVDTASMDGQEACRLYQQIARDNADRKAGSMPLRGLAYALNPETYGG